MIGIINYGVGNIKAFSNIYKRLNLDFRLIETLDDFDGVSKLILPGVGAFDHTMKKLSNSGLRDKLDDLVLNKKIPILGICVGMQLMAEQSDEGKLNGLGWVKGKVCKFMHKGHLTDLPLPHMGWNQITPTVEHPLFEGLKQHSRFYFLHSYYFECDVQRDIIAMTKYGNEFSSVIQADNIYGMQCHPEKSHHNGIVFLKNFGEF
ncbi:imidazole glycerol phosphate synthase subunit HisH [Thiotrichales bacterium 19S9-12]|nr:imidazole glycerol phosphate synthase subunit HisH [Thiotrichales bacterium 19S9-11]MCF6810961.1 imidazole glycerol phosphate synthase subunit HisH [Thiotrichales bacterium 19S9-12]